VSVSLTNHTLTGSLGTFISSYTHLTPVFLPILHTTHHITLAGWGTAYWGTVRRRETGLRSGTRCSTESPSPSPPSSPAPCPDQVCDSCILWSSVRHLEPWDQNYLQVLQRSCYIHVVNSTHIHCIVAHYSYALPNARSRPSGRLEFDFVSEQRVGKDDFILNDVRYAHSLWCSIAHIGSCTW